MNHNFCKNNVCRHWGPVSGAKNDGRLGEEKQLCGTTLIYLGRCRGLVPTGSHHDSYSSSYRTYQRRVVNSHRYS